MFSWSLKWLWAQCLVAAALLFLLSHITLPDLAALAPVKGSVTEVGSISRKGIGGYYELNVRSEEGNAQRVLVSRRVASEAVMQSLIGRPITARINISSEAVELSVAGVAGLNFDAAHSVAAAQNRQYDMLGWTAMICALLSGCFVLARRNDDSLGRA